MACMAALMLPITWSVTGPVVGALRQAVGAAVHTPSLRLRSYLLCKCKAAAGPYCMLLLPKRRP